MKTKLSCLLVFIFCLAACSNQFDTKSYDTVIVENFNTAIEDIAVLEELISPEVVGDTVIVTHFQEQSGNIILRIDEVLVFLEKKQVPANIEDYKRAAIAVFQQFKELVEYDLTFTSFDVQTPDHLIESFSQTHDEMNIRVHTCIDSFALQRQKILDSIKD